MVSTLSWFAFILSLYIVTILKSVSVSASTIPIDDKMTKVDEETCLFYLIPSLIPHTGRGVVAGRAYASNEFLHVSKSIVIPKIVSEETQLINYVFGTNNVDYHAILLGNAQIYNHKNPSTVSHFWVDDIVPEPYDNMYETFSNYPLAKFLTKIDIDVGVEMFSLYGVSEWFEFRNIHNSIDDDSKANIKNIDNHVSNENFAKFQYTQEELDTNGHCLSNTEIKISTISNIGHGLFARKSFKKGEIVSISPMLALSKSHLSQFNSLAMNYCFGHRNSDLLLFPVGDVGVINHNYDFNLEIEWFNWNNYSSSKKNITNNSFSYNANNIPNNLKFSVEDLLAFQFAPLDFAYIASRDIMKGEELFINYGDGWVHDWNDVSITIFNMVDKQLKEQGTCGEGEQCHVDESGNVIKTDDFPIFRRFIDNIDHLYQLHWLDKSI